MTSAHNRFMEATHCSLLLLLLPLKFGYLPCKPVPYTTLFTSAEFCGLSEGGWKAALQWVGAKYAHACMHPTSHMAHRLRLRQAEESK